MSTNALLNAAINRNTFSTDVPSKLNEAVIAWLESIQQLIQAYTQAGVKLNMQGDAKQAIEILLSNRNDAGSSSIMRCYHQHISLQVKHSKVNRRVQRHDLLDLIIELYSSVHLAMFDL
jgi:hypothetical protein